MRKIIGFALIVFVSAPLFGQDSILDFIEDSRESKEGRVVHVKTPTYTDGTRTGTTYTTTKVHIVQPGDTFYKIAQRYGTDIDVLAALNAGLNINNIIVGQEILIPGQTTQVELKPLDENVAKKAEEVRQKPTTKIVTRVSESEYYKDQSSGNGSSAQPAKGRASNPNQQGQMDFSSVKMGDGRNTHIVQKGETLYSISKMYGISIDELKRLNGLPDNSISIDQVIVLRSLNTGTGSSGYTGPAKPLPPVVQQEPVVQRPVEPAPAMTKPASRPAVQPTGGDMDYSKLRPVHHRVNRGETLYSISRKYEQSLQAIQTWNGMSDVKVKKGQKIIVGWQEFPAEYQPNVIEGTRIDEPLQAQPEVVPAGVGSSTGVGSNEPAWDPSMAENTSADPILVDAMDNQEKIFRNKYNLGAINFENYDFKKRKGTGTWMRGNKSHDQNLYALHKDLPVNTIIRVLNPMNDRSVYVKVVSTLPPAAGNENIELKLTSAAVKRLNLRDKKFILEYSYYLPK